MTYFARLRHVQVASLLQGMRGEFVIYSASTLSIQISKLLTALVVARLIGPSDMGWWNSLQPFLLYGTMFHLGAINGMGRNAPFYEGQGEPERATFSRQASFATALFSGILSALLALIVSFSLPEASIRLTLQLFALALLGQQWYAFLFTFLISSVRFRLLSVQQIAVAVLLPLVSVPLTYYIGLNGFIIAQSLVNLAVCGFITWKSEESYFPVFDWSEIKTLIRTGFPIMAAGNLYDLLRSLDRWVILFFLGSVAVGHYTLALLSLQALTLIPRVITAQFYPRMSKRFGEINTYRSVWPLLVQCFKGTAGLVVLFGTALLLFIRPLTFAFLPQYQEGIPAAIIIAIGIILARPVIGSLGAFLNAVGQANKYLAAQLSIVFLQIALTIGLVKLGWGLSGVALGVAMTQVLGAIILSAVVYHLFRNEVA